VYSKGKKNWARLLQENWGEKDANEEESAKSTKKEEKVEKRGGQNLIQIEIGDKRGSTEGRYRNGGKEKKQDKGLGASKLGKIK